MVEDGRRLSRRIRDRLDGTRRAEIRRTGILERFQEIGGNAPLESARVVCLGESHGWHNEDKIGAFIRAYGERGDIILVEGVQRMEQPTQESGIHDAYGFRRDFTVLGWDDLELREEAVRLRQKRDAIYLDQIQARDDRDIDKFVALRERYLTTDQEYNNIAIDQRNQSMVSTLQEVQQINPEARVFIIAGARHFTEDEQLISVLQQENYIALRPKMNEIVPT